MFLLAINLYLSLIAKTPCFQNLLWECVPWLLCVDHLCDWQICNDWTIECKEWRVQFWCCPAWASDWEETCWSHFTTWTAESSDMGTNHYLLSHASHLFSLSKLSKPVCSFFFLSLLTIECLYVSGYTKT